MNHSSKAPKQSNKMTRKGKTYEIVSLQEGGSILRILRKPITPPRILPKFWIRGKVVHCDDKKLDLTRKPMTLRLIQAFCKQPDLKLSKDHLVNYIYDGFQPWTKSARFNDILAQNITKLISRARILLSRAFDDQSAPWIDFFSYDPEDETWNLFQLKNHYLKLKELEFAKRIDCKLDDSDLAKAGEKYFLK